MVAYSNSTQSTEAEVGLNNTPITCLNKCRYKTGKCTNVRSSKRNGQPHQLCLYHRDKANKIQRKFDRQKRQVARCNKDRTNKARANLSGLSSPTSISMLDMAALAGLTTMNDAVSPVGSVYSTSSSMSYSSLASGDAMYTPNSVDCCLNESAWTGVTPGAASYYIEYDDMPLLTSCHQSYLSSDEIDFLCSAILE